MFRHRACRVCRRICRILRGKGRRILAGIAPVLVVLQADTGLGRVIHLIPFQHRPPGGGGVGLMDIHPVWGAVLLRGGIRRKLVGQLVGIPGHLVGIPGQLVGQIPVGLATRLTGGIWHPPWLGGWHGGWLGLGGWDIVWVVDFVDLHTQLPIQFAILLIFPVIFPVFHHFFVGFVLCFTENAVLPGHGVDFILHQLLLLGQLIDLPLALVAGQPGGEVLCPEQTGHGNIVATALFAEFRQIIPQIVLHGGEVIPHALGDQLLEEELGTLVIPVAILHPVAGQKAPQHRGFL